MLTTQQRALISNVSIRDAYAVGPSGALTKVRSVTYMIGTHGPFTDEYPVASFNSDAVQQGWAQRIQQLTDLGVLPQ